MMRAHFRARRDEAGFTLVELLVAMVILGIVLSLTTGVLIRAMDQNSNLTQESEAQNRNNVGMEQLTRSLRQAVFPTNGTNKTSSIITTATGTQVTFTTRLSSTSAASANAFDTAVVQMTAQFNTTTHNLVWGTGAQNTCTVPGATVCTYAAPTLSHTLVYGVRNDGGSTSCPSNTSNSPVFQYWYVDPSGNLAAWVSGTNTLNQISVVQINLWTQTQTGPQKPACVNLTDYVQLRNWQ